MVLSKRYLKGILNLNFFNRLERYLMFFGNGAFNKGPTLELFDFLNMAIEIIQLFCGAFD